MIIKCISIYPSEEQIQRFLGPGLWRNREFGVVIGREYLVLGLTVNGALQKTGNGAWVDILMEPEVPTVIPVPLCLFEIVDARVSRFWELRLSDEGSITLWPPSFYRQSFLENVSDRVPDAVEEFWKVQARIASETNQISALE